MPNHLQFLFLASFFATFVALLALSNYLSSKLHQAGYDISRLILIGLCPSENTYLNQMSTSAPILGSVLAQVVALLLAAASGAFIYLKFGGSGTSSFTTYIRHPLTPVAI
jgi:cytochrome-b5 reductase